MTAAVHVPGKGIGSGRGLGAFAVILDDGGRVLLVHRRDFDLWNLPGGQVEPGETPWQAVVREVREEAGLEVAVERLAIVDYRPERDELVFTFRCTALGGAFVPNAEADASAYFPPDALPPNLPPRHVERVQPALTQGAEPLLRIQPGPTTREWLRAGQAVATRQHASAICAPPGAIGTALRGSPSL